MTALAPSYPTRSPGTIARSQVSTGGFKEASKRRRSRDIRKDQKRIR